MPSLQASTTYCWEGEPTKYSPPIGRTSAGEVFDLLGKDEGEAAAVEMGRAFTRARKYVLTRGTPDTGWSNSHRLGSVEELRAIKESHGPNLLIQGSSTLYPQLIAAGLLDRVTLMTFPVVLGSGKRLFGDGTPAKALQLVDHKIAPSGAVIATYEPAGGIEHGWAGPRSTSEREQARQRAIAEGRW